jgi:hypothetical protein
MAGGDDTTRPHRQGMEKTQQIFLISEIFKYLVCRVASGRGTQNRMTGISFNRLDPFALIRFQGISR